MAKFKLQMSLTKAVGTTWQRVTCTKGKNTETVANFWQSILLHVWVTGRL